MKICFFDSVSKVLECRDMTPSEEQEVYSQIPIPIEPQKTPTLCAIAEIIIDNGAVSSITTSAYIASAFVMDVGEIWVFFSSTQKDLDYIPLCYNNYHNVFVTQKNEDFFVISSTLNGVISNPESLSVEIKRVM